MIPLINGITLSLVISGVVTLLCLTLDFEIT